jgi:hypothetical protein
MGRRQYNNQSNVFSKFGIVTNRPCPWNSSLHSMRQMSAETRLGEGGEDRYKKAYKIDWR